MTLIAAIKDGSGIVYMGADGAATLDGRIIPIAQSKIVRLTPQHGSDMLIGLAGAARPLSIIPYLKLPEDECDNAMEYICTKLVDVLRKSFKDSGTSYKSNEREGTHTGFLIGYRGRIFLVEEDYSVFEPQDNYLAIGSGGAYALGAFYITDRTYSFCMTMADGSTNPLDNISTRLTLALGAAARHNPHVSSPFTLMVIGGPKCDVDEDCDVDEPFPTPRTPPPSPPYKIRKGL